MSRAALLLASPMLLGVLGAAVPLLILGLLNPSADVGWFLVAGVVGFGIGVNVGAWLWVLALSREDEG